jgi:MGT family glycosyltransferase
MESGDLFQRVLAGFRDLAAEVVITVGRDFDPRELGAQPANVHVERFMPQAVLLTHCDVVVSHAGSGSVLGALTHGLPMVLIPIGADQPLNAARCRTLGVAQVLDAVTATPGMIGAAVTNVLADGKAREVAARIRHEIVAMPGPEYAVTLLERLASERAPIVQPE